MTMIGIYKTAGFCAVEKCTHKSISRYSTLILMTQWNATLGYYSSQRYKYRPYCFHPQHISNSSLNECIYKMVALIWFYNNLPSFHHSDTTGSITENLWHHSWVEKTKLDFRLTVNLMSLSSIISNEMDDIKHLRLRSFQSSNSERF